jgi:replication factor C subunit 2/4
MDNIPWIEKYRPKKLEDLLIDDSIYTKIKKIIDDKNMPNIIITGIPGIGKTTTILCIAKILLGKYFDSCVLELNASDDRGIKVVQESITQFCKKKIIIDNPDQNKKTYAEHKIILLDEADNMTVKAQQLINNLMETYYETTRFAFTCNNSSAIIESIQSRAVILNYRAVTHELILSRLKKICALENVEYNDDGLDAIVTTSQGDMRQALNCLQTTYNGFKIINTDNVLKICDSPHPLIIKEIFIKCNEKDVKGALIELQKLKDIGFYSSDIILAMINVLKNMKIEKLNDQNKIRYIEEIGRSYLIISKGFDTELQLTGTICKLCI